MENKLCFFLPVSSGGWLRKGGDKALKIIERLNQVGIPSKLMVCGDILETLRDHPNIDKYPYLRKTKPDDLKIYEMLLAKADFLLFPTRADFTPHVICEANAFGTPVISTRIAGIPEMVIDGVNGFTLELDADIDEYVNSIRMIVGNIEYYSQLRLNSRLTFERKLNWSNACKRCVDDINQSLQ